MIKTLRLCLLVLLAVLLPLRGAMAVALCCPMAAAPSPSQGLQAAQALHAAQAADPAALHVHCADTGMAVPMPMPSDSTADHADAAANLHAGTAPADAAATAHAHGGLSTQTHGCCDLGAVTPLAASAPVLASALPWRTLQFAGITLPPPRLGIDRHERPPRPA